jgi:hypothetical protein
MSNDERNTGDADDEELEETPEDVVKILGFDPKEEQAVDKE